MTTTYNVESVVVVIEIISISNIPIERLATCERSLEYIKDCPMEIKQLYLLTSKPSPFFMETQIYVWYVVRP